jgi:drug/metabolite transporter (DMT)-like permease
MKALLRGISQILFVIAGLLFLVGGRAISEFTNADRVLAEILGIGMAFVFGIFGMVAKNAADNLDDEDSAGQ